MTNLRVYAAAASGIFRRDLTVYVTYRWRLATQYIGVLFSLAIFYYISRLVRVGQFSSPNAYFEFAAIGVIIVQVLQSTLDIPTAVRQELVAGTFERMAIAPFGPVLAILALFLFPLTLALFSMLVTLALATLIFGLDTDWASVPLALPVAAVGAIALGAIALFFAAMIVRYKQAPGAAYVVAAISLVAGFYFPPSLLPWWLEWASNVQPFTPAVELLRHLLVDQPLVHSAWVDVAKLLGFSAVLVPFGVAALVVAIERGRRTGTLTEY